MLLEYGERIGCKGFQVGIRAALGLLLKQLNVRLVIAHHLGEVLLITTETWHRGRLTEIQALLFGNAHQLFVRFRMVSNHGSADVFNGFAFPLLLGHLSHLNFHHPTKGSFADKLLVLWVELRRRGGVRWFFGQMGIIRSGIRDTIRVCLLRVFHLLLGLLSEGVVREAKRTASDSDDHRE